jgi:hypothetical protein
MFRALVALRRGRRLGRFNVLDVDGPAGEAVIAALACGCQKVRRGAQRRVRRRSPRATMITA